jgi:acyl phosphate:glycerol-3-phosphate acyltransferase
MSVGGPATLTAVSGYLLGSVPAAVIIAARHGVDIRSVGDRNPGYWNAKDTLGWRAALPVLVVDALKGAAAAGIGMLAARWWAVGVWWLPYLGGLAAMVGHAWPLFARFRGGRCVLTFLGAIIAINPIESLLALVVCIALLAVLRRFSLAVRIGVFALPVVQAFFDPRAHVAFTGAMMTLIGVRFAQAAVANANAVA